VFCRRDVEELRERSRSGSFPPVVLVHMGSPEDGEAFLGARWPEARAVSDPDARLFAAFGLGRGRLGQLFGPRVWLAGAAAAVRGHGVGLPVGDPRMMSGWFLLAGDRTAWSHVHEHAGARRRWDEAAAAWREALAARARP
jgi:hypothetical protein